MMRCLLCSILVLSTLSLASAQDPYDGWDILIDKAEYYDCNDYSGDLVTTVSFPAGEEFAVRLWSSSINPPSQIMLLEEHGSTDGGDRIYSETWDAPQQIAVSVTGDYFYIVQLYRKNPAGGYFTPPLTRKGQFSYIGTPPQIWEDARKAMEILRRIREVLP